MRRHQVPTGACNGETTTGFSRREFTTLLAGPIFLRGRPTHAAEPIDRRALVRRHNVTLRKVDPLAPLSVGNGEFAFTADVTGLQSFPEVYEKGIPLCTMSNWGWHEAPPPPGLRVEDFQPEYYDTYGRKVPYWTRSEGQKELYNWLRENPHRLHLGRVGLRIEPQPGSRVALDELAGIEQTLDLWTGVLRSQFQVRGVTVRVETCCHPALDLLAVRIHSEKLRELGLRVVFEFPYGSPGMNAADWSQPGAHRTSLEKHSQAFALVERRLDRTAYWVAIRWAGAAQLQQADRHAVELQPAAGCRTLEFSVWFTPSAPGQEPPNVDEVFAAAAQHWERFWTSGAAVELAASNDVRAKELERRVVLSQYLTAIQSSGSLPPQETGLTCNSWYGKFHLEMHWWHAAHFALWGRLPLLERSLPYYQKILPRAQQTARWQGYEGARWPKMTGPEGLESPSPIGPLLVWQQPHPIFYAELCYRERPRRETLETYREIVFETARFMASYAHWDERRQRYVLGPPVIPAQENHPPQSTWNPTFELEYWRWGLEIAQRWRERLGLPRNGRWQHVIHHLSPLPVSGGVYLAHENCPETFEKRNYDHPSMLAALGVLPGAGVDRAIMRRTLQRVIRDWQWERTWGWDYPMAAMTAARLGELEMAVDLLLMDTPKNRWLPNGHVWQRPNLPLYLPANGGLLYAIALMAAGWEGGPETPAPGFPKRGWTVRAEGLRKAL